MLTALRNVCSLPSGLSTSRTNGHTNFRSSSKPYLPQFKSCCCYASARNRRDGSFQREGWKRLEQCWSSSTQMVKRTMSSLSGYLAIRQRYYDSILTERWLPIHYRYEYQEMKAAIEAEQVATAGISYMSFFRTKGNRKRLYILVSIGLTAQWVGNGIISCEYHVSCAECRSTSRSLPPLHRLLASDPPNYRHHLCVCADWFERWSLHLELVFR